MMRPRLFACSLAVTIGAFVAASPAAPPPAAPKGAKPQVVAPVDVASLTVGNPAPFARAKETLALSAAELLKAAPGFELKKALVVDANGRGVLSQLVDTTGDDEPDELVFQADFAPTETKRFTLRQGERPAHAAPADYKVYGRFVRERHDDFVWENDLIAHRMYGPDLETWQKDPLVSSGIDTWAKRVPKLVVNEWYMTDDYHRDNGEGADFYGVGKSRGCGGLGLWSGGKLYPSRNFTHSRVLANGPIRLVFELTYAAWEGPGGVKVAETKRITLDAGTPFNRFESTFTGAAKLPLAVAIGISKHAGSSVQIDPTVGFMRTWEPLKGAKGEASGNLGCAVILNSSAPITAQNSDLDYLAITSTDAQGRLAYRVGSAWDKAGRVRDAENWGKTVEVAAKSAEAPLKIAFAPIAAKSATSK
jgi:unsaturated rhamnogalacturonyl hydrolase